MPEQILESAVYVAIALASIGLVAAGVMILDVEARMTRRLRGVELAATGLDPNSEPSALVRILGSILLIPGKDREEVEQYLQAAGYRDPRAAMIFGIVRISAVVIFATGLFFVSHRLGGAQSLTIMVSLMGACVGYLAPKIVLRMSTSRRKRKVSAELPFTLDIMVMMLEAGISVDQCFRTFAATEGRATPLVQETVAALVRDLDVGSPYELALTRWAERLGVPGGQELARVIQQGLSHGTPLVEVLKQFSREFAEKRVAAAREAVGKKSTTLTVIMVLFILPALMIVLTGPAVSSLAQTLQGLSE